MLLVAGVGAASVARARADDQVEVLVSTAKASDGTTFSVTNHLVRDLPAAPTRREYLVVWAGDYNAADTKSSDVEALRPIVNPLVLKDLVRDNLPAPDFLAVVDATKGSPTYGKVVNTATTGPLVENEPHHMQYLWHKGDVIYAGGLYSDITYVFDVSRLPQIRLRGVNLPTDTPCGSIPDAFWTLKDGTAYGTYMGGADVPGPCVYSDGQVRLSNGFGGSPGSIVHMSPDAKTLSEVPAALATGEDPVRCVNLPPLPLATCANPHGIQVREDLNRLIASDYAEPRNIVLDPVRPPSEYVFRDTVRIFDITSRNRPRLLSVSVMPDGPREERNPSHEEPRGIMEVTVTNLKGHRARSPRPCAAASSTTPPTSRWPAPSGARSGT